MGKRGPTGEPMALVKLKGQPGQIGRALKSGRLQAHDLAERVVSDIPVLDRERSEVFRDEITAEQFHKMIVDSVAGLKIIRQCDELKMNLLVGLLVQLQRMHVNGVEATVTDDDGNVQVNPEHKVYLAMVKQANTMLSEMGLSPNTRARIIADTAAASKDAVSVAKYSPFGSD